MTVLLLSLCSTAAVAADNPFRDLLEQQAFDQKLFEAGMAMSESHWLASTS